MKNQRAQAGLVAMVFLTSLLPCMAGYAAAQEKDSSAAQAKVRRYAVAHAHFGNNCAGYLYVSQESVRYEALVPANYKNHSFELKRTEITALGPWVLMGQMQNIAEIKTAHTTYHFWLLRKGTDLNAARSNLNAVAAPAQELLAAIRDPESLPKRTAPKTTDKADKETESPAKEDSESERHSASLVAGDENLAKSGRPPANDNSSGESDDVAKTESAHKLPAGALQGIYVGFGLDHSHMKQRDYYFTADGWVINNVPFVNMDNFDMTAYRNDPSNKLFVGRYRVDGNEIHIVWANNADRRDVIKLDETAANPAIDTYIPTCRCTGKKFSGKYHWSSPTDAKFVQFFPDGTFLDHGLTDQVVGVPNPHGYSGITDPPRNFRGTYSVRDQTLTFHFADGKQATVAFVVPKALEKAQAFEWMGLGHGSGVPGAETVILLMLYEEHYRVQP